MSDDTEHDRPEHSSTRPQWSVYLRIDHPDADGQRRPVVATLLEVDAEGYIPREVGLAADGTVIYVTRPGEYGRWNDSGLPLIPPHTIAFAERWRDAGRISQEEFERVFGPAAAALPETIGGTPLWLSNLVGAGCLLALALVVLGAVAAVLQLTGVWHLLG